MIKKYGESYLRLWGFRAFFSSDAEVNLDTAYVLGTINEPVDYGNTACDVCRTITIINLLFFIYRFSQLSKHPLVRHF